MSDEHNQQSAAPKVKQVFVVQQEMQGENIVGEASTVWQDIATVSIPANTPRRIALKEALKESGLIPGTGTVKLRALDVKSAEVHEPKAVQPPMEWTL